MEKALENFVGHACKYIHTLMLCIKEKDKRDELYTNLLKIYNAYQDNERDGVDYIFNLYDKEDVKCLIDCDVSVAQLAELHQSVVDGKKTQYFFFGQNYDGFVAFKTEKELYAFFKNTTDIIIAYTLAHPNMGDAFEWLYDLIVSSPLHQYNFFR